MGSIKYYLVRLTKNIYGQAKDPLNMWEVEKLLVFTNEYSLDFQYDARRDMTKRTITFITKEDILELIDKFGTEYDITYSYIKQAIMEDD